MTPDFAVTMNGRISTELKPRLGRSLNEELRHRLSLLDGTERFALLLWRLPPGVPFDRFDLRSGPNEYIQCAGGLSERFTCEIRRVESDGAVSQEVIGRAATYGEATEIVRWANNETFVQSGEVLDLDEVIRLFDSYLTRGDIPSSYKARDATL